MAKRSSQVHLLLTDEEKAAIREAARKQGVAVAIWLRLVIRARLEAAAGDRDELVR